MMAHFVPVWIYSPLHGFNPQWLNLDQVVLVEPSAHPITRDGVVTGWLACFGIVSNSPQGLDFVVVCPEVFSNERDALSVALREAERYFCK